MDPLRCGVSALLLVLVALPATTALAQAPASAPASQPAKPVTQSAVDGAIARAVQYLYSQQNSQGAFPNRHSNEYVAGGEALTVLALLRSGQPPEDARLKKSLEYLKAQQPPHTYTRSLRALVFALLAHDADYRKRLGEDVQWLLKEQQRSGGWGYGPGSAMTRLRPDWTDASNSQFALWALREAADCGLPVPPETWRLADAYWRRLQNEDGGWGYQPEIAGQRPQRPESHGSMTAAGVATHLLLADRLSTSRREPPDDGSGRSGSALADRLDRGLAWLTENYAVDQIPRFIWMVQPGWLYYYLHVIERVGDAAGLRTIGPHDYSAQVAGVLLSQQQANGSWGDSVIDASLAVLALTKARAPLVISRLQFGQDPGRDWRDAGNVSAWLSRNLPAPVTWQKVQAETLDGLAQSPLLYVCCPPRADMPAGLAEAVRTFIRNGGTLLVQAPPEDPRFAGAFQDYGVRLFPDYRRQDIAPEHPVWNLRFAVDPDRRPRLVGVGDGCRTRVFILVDDVSGAWHLGQAAQQPHLFALAGNIALYAGGGELPAGRFAAAAAATRAPPMPVRKTITVARLKYDGDFDTCPLAIGRLSEQLAHSLSTGLKEAPPADAAGGIDPSITLLWLTGNQPPAFSTQQVDNLRKYLANGGTLLIDPATGKPGFLSAAQGALTAVLGRDSVKPLPAGAPVLTGRFGGGIGADLSRSLLLRSASSQPAKPGTPALLGGFVGGRLAAVLSPYGLTCSIEGAPCVENVGYTTADARKIALNVILYAAVGGR